MLKEIKKTTIVIFASLFIMAIPFLINNLNHKKKTEVKYLEISLSEEEIIKLIEPLNQTNILRKAYISNETIDNETMLYFLFQNLDYENLEEREIIPQKIICQVNQKVSFISSTPCRVKVVPNEELIRLQKRFFNRTKDIEFKDFNYNGLNCKNDNTAYYCMISPYENVVTNYSFLTDILETEEELTIYEYYLSIDFNNQESCNKYFGKDICENIDELKQKPTLDNETIKKEGVLYKHTFKMGEEGYYLKQSTIEVM